MYIQLRQIFGNKLLIIMMHVRMYAWQVFLQPYAAAPSGLSGNPAASSRPVWQRLRSGCQAPHQPQLQHNHNKIDSGRVTSTAAAMAWMAAIGAASLASQIFKYTGISHDPLEDALQSLAPGTVKAGKNFQSILGNADAITAKHGENLVQLSVVLLGLTCVLLMTTLLRGVFGPPTTPGSNPDTLEALVLWGILVPGLSSVVMVLVQAVFIPMGQAVHDKQIHLGIEPVWVRAGRAAIAARLRPVETARACCVLCSQAAGRAAAGLEKRLCRLSLAGSQETPPTSSADAAATLQPASTVPWRASACVAVLGAFGYWTWSGVPWLSVLGLGGAVGCWRLLEGMAQTTVSMAQPPYRRVGHNTWYFRLAITDPSGTELRSCDRTFNDFQRLETALRPMCDALNLPIDTRTLPGHRGVASTMSSLSEAEAQVRGEQVAAWLRRLLLERRLMSVCSTQIEQFLNPGVATYQNPRSAGSGNRPPPPPPSSEGGGGAEKRATVGAAQMAADMKAPLHGGGIGGIGGGKHSGSFSLRKDSIAEKVYTRAAAMIAGPEGTTATEKAPRARNRSSSDPVGATSGPEPGALRHAATLVRLSDKQTLAMQHEENLELDRAQRLHSDAAEGFAMLLGESHDHTVRARRRLADCEVLMHEQSMRDDFGGAPPLADDLLQGGWFNMPDEAPLHAATCLPGIPLCQTAS